MLKSALPKAARTAVGLTVPLEDAADSLRWARRALTLVDQGIIDDAQVTLCEDHLFTLWLMSEPALIDELARRRLGELAALSTRRLPHQAVPGVMTPPRAGTSLTAPALLS
jgi:hypothetical protein